MVSEEVGASLVRWFQVQLQDQAVWTEHFSSSVCGAGCIISLCLPSLICGTGVMTLPASLDHGEDSWNPEWYCVMEKGGWGSFLSAVLRALREEAGPEGEGWL